jgi:hypothetical protein
MRKENRVISPAELGVLMRALLPEALRPRGMRKENRVISPAELGVLMRA